MKHRDVPPTEPPHDDVAALERDAAAQRGVAADDDQPAVRGRAAVWLALPSTSTRPPSCSRPGPSPRCRGRARSRACSCRRSSSPRGPRSSTSISASSPQATACAPLGLVTRTCAAARAGEVVQALVELAQRRLREVERLGGGARAPSALPLPDVHARRLGLPRARVSAPGSTAIARYSEAIATQSSFSAITAGLHAIGSRMTAKPSRVPTANV